MSDVSLENGAKAIMNLQVGDMANYS